jgi:hypothetical protein
MESGHAFTEHVCYSIVGSTAAVRTTGYSITDSKSKSVRSLARLRLGKAPITSISISISFSFLSEKEEDRQGKQRGTKCSRANSRQSC